MCPASKKLHAAYPPVTLGDVARSVGVSVSTVSRALSGKQGVDPAVAGRIVAAAEAVGYPLERYRANLLRSRLLGVVVPTINSPFYSSLIEGIERAATGHGFNLLLSSSQYDLEQERACLEILVEKRVAGILISPVAITTEPPPALVDRQLPLVQIDRHSNALQYDLVQTDSVRGAYDAVKLLLQQGYSRIAIISGPKTHSTGIDRLNGYLAALRDANITPLPEYVQVVEFMEQTGYEAAMRLLALTPRPDALFVTNVDMTIGTIRALHECNVHIPDDVGLVGFDEFPFASILVPPLTTVEQPIEMLAFTAVDLLMRRIASRVSSEPVVIRMSPKLNQRRSTESRLALATVPKLVSP